MPNIIYTSGSTERTSTTLLSDGMTFIGVDGSNAPLHTEFSSLQTAIGGGGGGSSDYILLQEQQTSGTNGGASTTSRDTRILNTEVSDSGGHCTLSSNQFTLAAGTYTFRVDAPGHRCGEHKAFLRNVSDSADEAVGTNARSYNFSSGAVSNSSVVVGKMVIASSKTFEIQHIASAATSSNGWGLATSLGTEIYTTVELWKTA